MQWIFYLPFDWLLLLWRNNFRLVNSIIVILVPHTCGEVPAVKSVVNLFIFSYVFLNSGMSVCDQGFNGNIGILNNSQTPLKSFQLHVVWVLNFIALKENDNRVCDINQVTSSKCPKWVVFCSSFNQWHLGTTNIVSPPGSNISPSPTEKLAGTHLYIYIERSAVRIKCLA